MTVGYRSKEKPDLRVLFCFGVSQSFFDEEQSSLQAILERLTEAFIDLQGRFGVEILATFDDDQLMVGPSVAFPWTAYAIATAPDYDSVVRVCDLLREQAIGDYRLWRYLRVEARIGRALFFIDQ